MLSNKAFAGICILLAIACSVSASNDDESYDNSADQSKKTSFFFLLNELKS